MCYRFGCSPDANNMEVGENEYTSIWCWGDLKTIKTRIRKDYNPRYFHQNYHLECIRPHLNFNRFERYYYYTHTVGGDESRCLSHRFHFSTNCTINIWKEDARHQWDYTPYPPKISNDPYDWNDDSRHGKGDADVGSANDNWRRSSPTYPKILLDIHALLMGDYKTPRPFNVWYWKEVARVRHYQEWLDDFLEKGGRFNIFSCHSFKIDRVMFMLKQHEQSLMRGAGKFKVKLRHKKGILPAETAYSPLNHFWKVDYISQPLTGAYLSPRFRLEEYTKAIENLADPNRAEKLLNLV